MRAIPGSDQEKKDISHRTNKITKICPQLINGSLKCNLTYCNYAHSQDELSFIEQLKEEEQRENREKEEKE